MKWIKLTAYNLFLFSFLLTIISCEKDAEKKIQKEFSKSGIAMTGAQETPAAPSSALGSLDVFYTKETRILSYTVTWSGLSDSVLLMHIHGLAPAGFAASPVQNIVATSNSIYAQKTSGKYTYGKAGKITNSLLVDGVVVKEADLLNGLYYLNIHTSVYPGGEIRAQIVFQ